MLYRIMFTTMFCGVCELPFILHMLSTQQAKLKFLHVTGKTSPYIHTYIHTYMIGHYKQPFSQDY